MKRVALIRPNDFIVDHMAALISRLGLEPVRPADVHALQTLSLEGLVGAVLSTAVSSPMPLTFPEAAWALRQRSPVPLVATTMLRDAAAVAFIAGELKGKPGDFTPFSTALEGGAPRLVGAPRGLLVLRFEEIQAAQEPVLALLRRHFHLG